MDNQVIKQHPALIIVGSIVGISNAVIGVLLGFTIVHWTQAQVGLIIVMVNAFVAPISAILSQMYTTPFDPVQQNTAETTYLLRAENTRLQEAVKNGGGRTTDKPKRGGRKG